MPLAEVLPVVVVVVVVVVVIVLLPPILLITIPIYTILTLNTNKRMSCLELWPGGFLGMTLKPRDPWFI